MKNFYSRFFVLAAACLFWSSTLTGQSTNQFLFSSSNTSGEVTKLDITDNQNIVSDMLTAQGVDGDGVHYDPVTDILYQVNRTNNRIDVYSEVVENLMSNNPPNLWVSAEEGDFTNGREIAVVGTTLVVAQDANDANDNQNKLVVFNFTDGGVVLDRAVDVSINLWGIHANGNDLMAIVDNSNELAIFRDFFTSTATDLAPDQIISVENLVRTHGLSYDADGDYLILTDIGDAMNDKDGALVGVANFTAASMDGMIRAEEQARVSGGSSLLGNPVDVAFNKSDGRIYVAERARNGGMILGFKKPVLSGGIAPFFTQMSPGASSVHVHAPFAQVCDFVDGGSVELEDGGTETTIFIDGEDNPISFTSTVDPTNHEFTYVVTDSDGKILGIPPGNTVNFEPAGLGLCKVYGLSYTGMILVEMGDDLFNSGDLTSGCFDLSSNNLDIYRISPQAPQTQIFASSNQSGNIGRINIFSNGGTAMQMFSAGGDDADGIYFDKDNDRLFQLNRSDNRVDVYNNVNATLMAGDDPVIAFSSTADFINGREIAVSGKKLVVAQDANDANGMTNKFYVYEIDSDALTLINTYDSDINLWGIHANAQDLFAIEDNSNNVAVYNDFFDNEDGAIVASNIVAVDGLVRTHGLTYNSDNDKMILTDIGEASSPTDGFLVVINDFQDKIDDNTISADEQIRVGGGASLLGNPVDVAYDAANDHIYVAERARNGGMILGFKSVVLTGGIAPFYTKSFPAASALHIFGGQDEFCGFINAGTVAFADGNSQATIIVDDTPDPTSFTSTAVVEGDQEFTYVVTDGAGMILGIPPGDMVDFNGSGLGACRIYGLVYTGDLLIEMGDDLFGTEIATNCAVLSSNSIVVNRISPQAPDARLFASSNTTGNVGVVNLFGDNVRQMQMFMSQGMDADGIYYDEMNDRLFQLNRIDNRVDVYTNVAAALDGGTEPTFVGSSSSDFTNGRGIAVSGNKLVVANDVDDANTLVTYNIGDDNSLTLDKINNVDFNLWGVHLNGSILFAIADNSNNLALFKNFFNKPAGDIMPEHFMEVENMNRTHGLVFVPDRDMMILTDIGSAMSDKDGALVVIRKFSTRFMDDEFISADEQTRVSGFTSQLGNPVDVTFSEFENMIYVAERARNGGMILGFRNPKFSGGAAPTYVKPFAGASSVAIPGNAGDLCNFLNGGNLAFEFGGTETTIFIDDEDDVISFDSTGTAVPDGVTFTYVVTDGMGMILGIPPGDMVEFNGAGLGACRVYGLAYTGELQIGMGDDLFAGPLSDDCFDLSDNSLLVDRIAPEEFAGQIYLSTNTTGVVGVANIIDDNTATMGMFASQGADADGLIYDEANDRLYQINRSANVIDVYGNVSTNPTYMMSSTSNFINGRGLALIDNAYLVVAQDANDANAQQNRLIVYDITNGITLEQSFDVGINLWGIQGVGNDLFAIIDNSNSMAIFENLRGNTDGSNVNADRVIIVDDLVRTHGLEYDEASDYLILTDIGSAAKSGDGALVAISNFTVASGDDVISADEQVRVSGGTSLLGNPVDVDYDAENNIVYVAERAREGGLLLGFRMPNLSGGIAPVYKKAFPGCSSLFLNSGGNDINISSPETGDEIVTRSRVVTDQTLYPVPASEVINVEMESTLAVKSTVRIFSVTGTLMYSEEVNIHEGFNKITLDISNLPSGIMYLTIPEINSVSKFTKM